MTFRSKRALQIGLLIIPSIILMYAALFLTLRLWYPGGLSQIVLMDHYLLFSLVFVGWLFSFVVFHVVDAWFHQHVRTFVSAFLSATLVNGVFAVIVFYVQPNLLITPRRFLVVLIGLTSVFLFVWLFSMRLALRKLAVSSVYFLSLPREYSYLSHLDEPGKNQSFMLAGNLSFDDFFDTRFAMSLEQLWLVVPEQQELPALLLERLDELHRQGATIIPYASFYEQYVRRVPLAVLDNWWFITDVQAKRGYEIMKRFLDVCVGLVLSSAFFFTFPFVALLIRLLGSGPIFFIQERHALDGRRFKIVKYRTMRMGTRTDTWTKEGDDRITSIGHFLRKSRLDELPQCLNILKGDMSIIGPRPEQVHISERMDSVIPFYGRRTLIRPGLTGWAQLHVYASDEEGTRKKLEYDLYYLKHRSVSFDLEIFFKTIIHVIRFSGR
jgi:lipopolysaccharide/colanic/teichoic acid biosynthesis glycosyltransferase